MINDETSADRTARAMVLRRLLEVLLIEALRSTGRAAAPPGLLRGMADPLLAPTLRRIHADPGRSMTVEALAQDAAMSRSTFFDRLRREVGVPLMEYATGWRMALAKELLRKDVATAEIAQRVGYGSASAFSVAFTRHVGKPQGAHSRESTAAQSCRKKPHREPRTEELRNEGRLAPVHLDVAPRRFSTAVASWTGFDFALEKRCPIRYFGHWSDQNQDVGLGTSCG
jgi:AraC-like DNA-binding protein